MKKEEKSTSSKFEQEEMERLRFLMFSIIVIEGYFSLLIFLIPIPQAIKLLLYVIPLIIALLIVTYILKCVLLLKYRITITKWMKNEKILKVLILGLWIIFIVSISILMAVSVLLLHLTAYILILDIPFDKGVVATFPYYRDMLYFWFLPSFLLTIFSRPTTSKKVLHACANIKSKKGCWDSFQLRRFKGIEKILSRTFKGDLLLMSFPIEETFDLLLYEYYYYDTLSRGDIEKLVDPTIEYLLYPTITFDVFSAALVDIYKNNYIRIQTKFKKANLKIESYMEEMKKEEHFRLRKKRQVRYSLLRELLSWIIPPVVSLLVAVSLFRMGILPFPY